MVSQSKNITYKDMLSMPAQELLEWCDGNLLESIPETLETEDQINEVKRKLNVLTNYYAFASYASTYANLEVRRLKGLYSVNKTEQNKEKYDDMMERRIVLETVTDILKRQYQSLSRSYSVVQDQRREAYMLNNR